MSEPPAKPPPKLSMIQFCKALMRNMSSKQAAAAVYFKVCLQKNLAEVT